jgi:hypothetical protein
MVIPNPGVSIFCLRFRACIAAFLVMYAPKSVTLALSSKALLNAYLLSSLMFALFNNARYIALFSTGFREETLSSESTVIFFISRIALVITLFYTGLVDVTLSCVSISGYLYIIVSPVPLGYDGVVGLNV